MAAKARLHRVDTAGPGVLRRRHGRGFRYLDAGGAAVRDPEVLQRIRDLAIPPAWEDVWIWPDPCGHIQATGVDDAGRKQYVYHPRWRERRDQRKFDDMLRFARALPALRRRVEAELRNGGLSRDYVCACAVRLLDRGFFRVGGEDYAERNESFGLATLKKRHVRLDGDVLVFDYPSKHRKRRVQVVADPAVADVVARLKRRSGGGDALLAYKRGRRWADLRSDQVNAWLKEATGEDVSAKEFRTWAATVLAAVALAVSGDAPDTKAGRRRAINRAFEEVARYLGNTPAIARGAYVDLRILDRYRDGATIDDAIVAAAADRDGDATAIQGPVEEAVLELLA